MSRRIQLAPHLSVTELEQRYRHSTDGVERSHWQILWLLAQGRTAAAIAAMTGYSTKWIGQIAQRYNTYGVATVGDGRHHNPGKPRLASATDEAALAQALQAPPPSGGFWTGPVVAQWLAARHGQPVHPQRGWELLRRLDYTPQVPRPHHTLADPAAQTAFKKTRRPEPRSGGNLDHG